MPPLKPLCATVVLLGLLASPAGAQWRQGPEYKADRSANASARGATEVLITAKSGSLDVVGRPGLTEVRARGTARTSHESWLDEIRLTAVRRGDAVVIEVDIPDRDGRWHENGYRSLDLIVEVPEGMAVDVQDGSGELSIRNTGSVILVDGSGDIRIEGARGDVRISDGSGSMTLRNIRGSVLVERDGSGEIDVAGVTGSVHVRVDGSGGIDVRDVEGDFTVGRDGTGGISHSNVKGQVSIPEKTRDRYRHRTRRP